MAFFIYNIFTLFLIIPVFIFNLLRSLRLGWQPAVFERFGFVSDKKVAHILNRRIIMVHAVSVGEAAAARSLLEALKNCYPDAAILVTCSTETGRTTAASIPEVDLTLFLPFDFLFSVKRFLSVVSPSVIIIMETEIWLNLIHESFSRKIPVLLANGRISDGSFKKYLMFSWLFKSSLERFSHICVQTQTYKERIVSIGATESNVTVTGNLKYDSPLRVLSAVEKHALKSNYRIPEDAFVITAGSTHAGEDEVILSAYSELCINHRALFLVLAPRHPQRVLDVEKLLNKFEISYYLLSKTEKSKALPKYCEVLLIDKVGELLNLYSVSDIAFVGGSLVPVGGHNLLEPASAGVPSIYGKHVENFKEIAELVSKSGSGVQAATEDMFKSKLQEMIEDSSAREKMSASAIKMITQNRGSTERHLKIFRKYFPSTTSISND